MIEAKFSDALVRFPNRPFLLSSTEELTYGQVFQRCRSLSAYFLELKGAIFACYMADSIQLVIIMLAAGMSGKKLLVLNRDFTDQQLPGLLKRYDVDVLIADVMPSVKMPCAVLDPGILNVKTSTGIVDTPDTGEIYILTSGTAGQPKCARYSWSDLFAQVGDRPAAETERWLLAYRLNHFAGLQMLIHVLCNGSSLVLLESSNVAEALRAISSFSVTHVSSTPTFWRYALATLSAFGHGLHLEQITLGSEPVSAALLDQLSKVFPDTRIVHIYASTEAGSCVSVSDMRAGLPAKILHRDAGSAVQFRVIENELYVRSAHGMIGYAGVGDIADRDGEGWLATGDMVSIEDDRIMFTGRRSETINVGGVKVHPLEVENIITALPGVKIARVYGKANPVAGQIVAVDLIIMEGYSEQEVEDSVHESCLVTSRHARPRNINFVEEIETSNYKLKRQ